MIEFVLGALVTTVFFTIGLIYKRKISDIVEKLEKKVENREKASFFYPKSDAQAAFEALAATVAELKATVEAMQPEEKKEDEVPANSEMSDKLDAALNKLSALEVELAARGDNAISGNGSAVSIEDAYASGDRATKFEIVRKALEARDFSLISKLKNNK